ncbi:restriction endonuclease subunit S [Lactococcus petauri]|uniref:restriction endonuclease subunit S n=1 Tax=Lactococcus petauri TaxID=1940789 RepID=UPI0022E08D1E|nr:restriction endonuclease subunit S [Lactococcus petauri]
MAKIDDSVKKKVPELRFPGFTDDWEERKFADFIDVKSGKDYKHLNSGSIPVYGTGGYMLSVDRALSDIDAIGIGRKGTIDKPYLLKAPFWTVDTLFYAVPKQNIDLQFSLSIFKKINWKKFDESTGVPSLSKTVINSVGASVPSYEEQKKIGSFFKQLDDTIDLHQRKLDLLKEQKKGYLQKMFPKNGAKVPELRFAGFADDWEERKLGQYTKLITKGTTPKDKTGIGDVNFVKVENITNGKIYPINKIKQHEHDNYLKRSRLEEKDILFSIAGTLGRTAIVNKSILPANTNQALAIIRGYDFDTNFLITSLAGNVVKEYIRRNPTVGAQPNLSLEQVGNLLVNTPNAEEQQKIGSFFKQLDDTIALHQRKLDLLKEQKKGFLQKMFV